VFNNLLPIHAVCNGTLFSFSQLLNQKAILFNERRLIDGIIFSIFAPSLQFVSKAIRKQLTGLPNSIVLRLDLCSLPHTSSPVIACNLSWIDEGWTPRQYFIGLIPPLPVSRWSQTPSSISNILTSIGLQVNNCLTLTATRSPHIPPLASSLQIEYCVEDLFGSLMNIVVKVFRTEGVLVSSSVTLFLNGNDTNKFQSLTQSLRRANSLIEFLNTNFEFPLTEGLVGLQFESDSLEWEHLISISSSLSR
jgi:hypothetical protein